MSADFDLALEEYLYTLTDEEFEALVARTRVTPQQAKRKAGSSGAAEAERRFGKGTK
ncbi:MULTISPECIES: hypothetical protein [Rhodococcus]|uniref:hypothetical protein n=1 Tax=Rhodococcus TaxID=1827 RepID=UPI00130D7D82|nr:MULTISPECIES: hypothetical protein [Rhodococcus]MBP2523600.1 hypothetical protein [Rhodococcus sp. PvP104]MCZ4546623.1 hypothetical protein [Rhodococcus qingshengii]MDA3634724.1 hypothetical protein [Rhodococcus sp. C-2]